MIQRNKLVLKRKYGLVLFLKNTIHLKGFVATELLFRHVLAGEEGTVRMYSLLKEGMARGYYAYRPIATNLVAITAFLPF